MLFSLFATKVSKRTFSLNKQEAKKKARNPHSLLQTLPFKGRLSPPKREASSLHPHIKTGPFSPTGEKQKTKTTRTPQTPPFSPGQHGKPAPPQLQSQSQREPPRRPPGSRGSAAAPGAPSPGVWSPAVGSGCTPGGSSSGSKIGRRRWVRWGGGGRPNALFSSGIIRLLVFLLRVAQLVSASSLGNRCICFLCVVVFHGGVVWFEDLLPPFCGNRLSWLGFWKHRVTNCFLKPCGKWV